MSALSMTLGLLFLPASIEPAEESHRNPKYMCIGYIMGLAGFILHAIYIFPLDETNFDNLPVQLEAIMNGLVGALLGSLLFFMLLGFDTLVIGALCVRRFKSTLYGSFAPFLAMPLSCIPVHALFSGQLSMRVYFFAVMNGW
jgi:hypothetical protein